MVLPAEIIARWISTKIMGKKNYRKSKNWTDTDLYDDSYSNGLSALKKEELKLSNELDKDPNNPQIREELAQVRLFIKQMKEIENKWH